MRFANIPVILFSTFLALLLTACASTETRRGTGAYIDDKVITGKIKAALVADPDLKATEINVDTYKGTVQLSGFVDSAEAIPKAVALVRQVEGVKDVKNDMTVRR